ncbi:MAG: hypothetical protein FWH29_08345 [Methanobrevibacter sp.]|nr:hypothetical protein [Methanobrevibacter sp.]
MLFTKERIKSEDEKIELKGKTKLYKTFFINQECSLKIKVEINKPEANGELYVACY